MAWSQEEAVWPQEDALSQRIRGERRGNRRYRIVLELRWHVVRRRRVLESGTGRTLNLSSAGILFDAGRYLPPGLGVEISISWPALVNDVAPLELVVAGHVVRTDGSRVAMHVSQHEFRTASDSCVGVPRDRNSQGLKLAGPAELATVS